jgi:hypothetical protein
VKRPTKARLSALAVLLEAERSGCSVYISNITTELASGDQSTLRVYWQNARGLVEAGLAVERFRTTIALTDKGRAYAAEWLPQRPGGDAA